MLKATYVSMYKKEGKPVFVYAVSGSQELVDRYVQVKTEQGYNPVDENTGQVLFFTTRSLGTGSSKMELTINGNLVPAENELVHLESQIGTISDSTVKAAVANKAADLFLAQFGFGKATQEVPAEQAEPKLGVE